jgi:hypothetical protein
MPDLTISVESVDVEPYALAPTLSFQLNVANEPVTERVHTIVLRAQIQIDVVRRRYDRNEEERLRDLFGEPSRWAQTLRTMHWTYASTVAQSFMGSTSVKMPVPCSFDFNVAATKYFHGLENGEIPLSLLFSGSVFYEDEAHRLQVAPISWDKEASFRLPVEMWQSLMDTYYPNLAWLQLRRDVFERLYRYKVEGGIPTWEQALERLLPPVDEAIAS